MFVFFRWGKALPSANAFDIPAAAAIEFGLSDRTGGVQAHPQVNCQLCGAPGSVLYESLSDRLFSAPGVWSLRRCQYDKCGLVWLDPQPEPAEIYKLYDGYYTGSAARPSRPSRRWIKGNILAALLGYNDGKRTIDRLIGRALAAVPSVRDMAASTVLYLRADWRGRILDVGCGNGVMLKNLQQLGWQISGIDPDPEAVRVTNELLGPVATVGGIDSPELTGKFDVITMNHVIEHVPYPVQTLRECLLRLRPGGRLVLQTPNVESLGVRAFGQSWIAWDPPRHLHLFSIATLQRAAEEAGFQVDEVRTTPRDAHFAWTVSREIKRRGRAQDVLLRRYAGVLDTIASGVFQLVEAFSGPKSGEEVVLLARRPGPTSV